MEKIWLKNYPQGVKAEIDADAIASLPALLDEALRRHAQKPALEFLGVTRSYAWLDEASRRFAGYLQSLGLERGARVAVMMPNCPQYFIAATGILRAGLIIVNVNPLYTAHELEHQLKDSGAVGIVILENFAATLQAALPQSAVRHIVLSALGDTLGGAKGALINFVVRRVKRMVPAYSLPGAVRFKTALKAAAQRESVSISNRNINRDIAALQYTGGTTGVAKAAALSHRNLIANVLQTEAWFGPALSNIPAGVQPRFVCALPLYHIFSFTVNLLLGLRLGVCNIVVPNARDFPAFIKTLARRPFHVMTGVNTLFSALMNHPNFGQVDWSALKLTIGGAMAVQKSVAERWRQMTGCPVCEGYGLSEASPVISCNPTAGEPLAESIGLPMPSTEIEILSETDEPLPVGAVGEICARGPQVMQGYWRRSDETAKVMTPSGFLRTGDMGLVDEHGFLRITDRKKDMILVSGFNVYPNEVEAAAAAHPGVLECAAIGRKDEHSGEAVELIVVRKDPNLSEETLRAFLAQSLTGYKRPRIITFRETPLPKTPVGKILRRELRS